MAGEAFADITQLGLFLGAPVDDARAGRLALDVATGMVQARLGQRISFVADDMVILDPVQRQPKALLPELPVAAVTAVETLTYADPLLPAWGLQPVDRYTWTQTGVLDLSRSTWGFLGVTWLGYPQSVRVTYSHGWQTIPDELVGVVLGVAARQLRNPLNEQQESLGGYQVRYSQHPTGFSPLEALALDRYKIANIA